jgi:transcriptional antiterminator
MPEKSRKTVTLDEIAKELGLSKKTVRKKMAEISFFFVKKQRKRYYTPTEAKAIYSLFE